MALSREAKDKINNLIFERAYEIEEELCRGDFLLSKMLGLKNEAERESVALACAVKEIRKALREDEDEVRT